MTAVVPDQGGQPVPTTVEPTAGPTPRTRPRPSRLIALPPAWPLTALIAFFPLWWLLGIGEFSFLIFAVPMAFELLRRRPLKLPPGFALWLLFLLWVVAGFALLGVNPPGTVASPMANRVSAAALHAVQFATVTIILLYIGNLSERELSRTRLLRLLGLFFTYGVAGGLLGVVVPRFQLTSPLWVFVPGSLRSNISIYNFLHPASAQVTSVLGYTSPRPSAPFPFTNFWGGNLAMLIVWFVVGWLILGRGRRRAVGVIILAVSAVPIVYSLNRGMWVSLGIAVVYVGIRMALQGRFAVLTGLVSAAALAGVILTTTPLGTLISGRLAHGNSNGIRKFTTTKALDLSLHSPVIGFGSTRKAAGSARSITVGQSADCPACGNASIGSNGVFWNVLVSEGYVGAGFFVGFFLFLIFTYRHDRSAIGMGGVLVLCITLISMFYYDGLTSPLSIVMMSIGLLWRNGQAQAAERPTGAPIVALKGAPA